MKGIEKGVRNKWGLERGDRLFDGSTVGEGRHIGNLVHSGGQYSREESTA